MESEEKYLREELNNRINLVYTHSNTMITFITSLFSAVIALVSLFYVNLKEPVVMALLPLIFLLALFVILFSSQKFKENFDRIIDISSYFSCFYNQALSKNNSIDTFNTWEFSLFDLQKNEKKAHRKKLFKMNGEYFFLGMVSFTLMITSFIVAIGFLIGYISASTHALHIFYFVLYIIIAVLVITGSIYILIEVYRNTNLKLFVEKKQKCIKKWLDYAISKKYYTAESIKEKFGDTFFDLLK